MMLLGASLPKGIFPGPRTEKEKRQAFGPAFFLEERRRRLAACQPVRWENHQARR